jgi:hypothetical protein
MALAAAHIHRPVYLREMMQRLDIDPAGAILPQSSLSYFTALHRCESCPCKQACRNWLDDKPTAVNAPPRFCPSADILFELQFDRLHH